MKPRAGEHFGYCIRSPDRWHHHRCPAVELQPKRNYERQGMAVRSWLFVTWSGFVLQAGAVAAQVPATQQYFAFTRPAFSGEKARAVVAFMDNYFRVPGNTGFNASIHHVEEILKRAGY